MAGKLKIRAVKMTPSMPNSCAKGSSAEQISLSSVCPSTEQFASSQITSPAGAATAAARPSTKRVRSSTERTITLPIWGRR